jgi:hypothetical protein
MFGLELTGALLLPVLVVVLAVAFGSYVFTQVALREINDSSSSEGVFTC